MPGAGRGLMGLTFEGVKEGGASVPLTDCNKEEFVELLTQQVLINSREQQLHAIKTGFLGGVREVAPAVADIVECMSATDLMLVLHGREEVSSALVRGGAWLHRVVGDCGSPGMVVFRFRFAFLFHPPPPRCFFFLFCSFLFLWGIQVESCTYSLGFPLGNPVRRWIRTSIRRLPPDDLRRFLIAVMHSPSLPSITFGQAQLHVVASDRTTGYLVPFGGFGHISVPSFRSADELDQALLDLVQGVC